MSITLFGNSIRSIPGSTNSIVTNNDQYELYYDLMDRVQGSDTIFAVSIGIRKSKSLRLGLYYSSDLFDFQMEGVISVLSGSSSTEISNIATQVTKARGDNSKRITRVVGKASTMNNNTQWEVEDFTRLANDTEPPIRLDPIITNEEFRGKSFKQFGPIDISYSVSDRALKLSGSITESNGNNAVIGFLAISSVESTYNIRVANSVVSGAWK